MRHILPGLLATLTFFAASIGSSRADNPMGYRLLSAEEAGTLPARHGALGLDVERSRQITDDGMTFDLLRIKQVRRGSAGDQAQLRPGDQIISLNGRVFPSLAAFAAYVGSMAPGSRAAVDYIPDGGGPAEAQRVSVRVGGAGTQAAGVPNRDPEPKSSGLSTGEKIAIGVGAAALLGCYEAGCFSKHDNPRAPVPAAQPWRSGVQPR